MSETLYIQTDKNVKVQRPQVYLQDIAQLTCSNSKVLNRCRVMPVLSLAPEQPGRYVMSVTDIIRQIQKKEENLEVSHTGEPSFIVTYEKEKHTYKIVHSLKTLLICLVSFFGTAFSIMTFNNDVDVTTLFRQIYLQFTGNVSDGYTVLEVSYSLGIGLGVIFFFNHFGRKKITQDPTPMQVQMRLYEDDVNTTVIEEIGREEKNVCGGKF